MAHGATTANPSEVDLERYESLVDETLLGLAASDADHSIEPPMIDTAFEGTLVWFVA